MTRGYLTDVELIAWDAIASVDGPGVHIHRATLRRLVAMAQRAVAAEAERADEWRRRRDADAARDVAKAASEALIAHIAELEDRLKYKPEICKGVTIEVDCGGGAWMTIENRRHGHGLEYPMRYGHPCAVRFPAASALSSYAYLLSSQIPMKEATRRLALMRAARRRNDAGADAAPPAYVADAVKGAQVAPDEIG